MRRAKEYNVDLPFKEPTSLKKETQ